MDLTIILALVAGAVIISLMGLLFWQSRKESHVGEEGDGQDARRVPAPGARNARARLRAAAAAAQQGADDDDTVDNEKMGAKKRAKLEAKAEKKAQREAEEREREDKKKKKEAAEEERRKAEEREAADEARREEEARKAKEEEERREREEYEKLKAAFSVEEEGFEENDQDQETLLRDFLDYIKNNKVVLLEDLAAHFRLKTQAVISRLQDLQTEGTITGVIDDRGKFIYISQQELEAVAKFVKQRGRVSITELAENSQRLINLNPTLEVEAT